jgi:threonine 3-dehydrogenase
MSENIHALTLDLEQDGWETSRGFIKREVPRPHLNEAETSADALAVVVKVLYAGVCGSDRGIWNRQAFAEMVKNSLAAEGKSRRILGHEFVGEIVEAGSQVQNLYGVTTGDVVSGDSHVTCGKCFQCRMGEQEVCQDQAILGISIDGIFAEYVKIPAKNLWQVDLDRIRPEVCALFDPFGNAVHALSKVDARGARVSIFGVGQIGLFSVLLARQFGAAKVIAVDVNEENLETARQLGAHETVKIEPATKDHDYDADPNVVKRVMELTYGKGVDISLEMSGFNSSVNNAVACTRFGGDIVFFGIKDGTLVIPNFTKLVVQGTTIHNVIGRKIFETWQISQRVLSDQSNGVQEKVWEIIMKGGQGTVIKLSEFTPELMEERMAAHPKLVFDIQH